MILGHEKQWQFLKTIALSNKTPHAFLFTGPESIGKKTIAIEFIKFINCQADKKPCGKCYNCLKIEKNQYPDFIFIAPEKKEITILQIRSAIYHLSLKPYGVLKSVVIDNAHLMNQEAQTCLLKTLEEPRGKTILFLITPYPEMLFETILSRTQRLKFFPFSDTLLTDLLEKNGCLPEEAKIFSVMSLGKPGLALSVFSSLDKRKEYQKKFKEIKDFSESQNPIFQFEYIKKISEKTQEEVLNVLEIWLKQLRSSLIDKVKQQDKTELILKLKNNIILLEETIFILSKTNVNTRLALESLITKL